MRTYQSSAEEEKRQKEQQASGCSNSPHLHFHEWIKSPISSIIQILPSSPSAEVNSSLTLPAATNSITRSSAMQLPERWEEERAQLGVGKKVGLKCYPRLPRLP